MLRRMIFMIVALAPATAMAQSLTLYSGTNYTGDKKVLTLVVGGFVARSADASGRWRVCTGPFGLIGCRTIDGKVPDLGGSGMTVLSAVYGVGTSGPTPPSGGGQTSTTPGTPALPSYGISLFAGTSYSGRQQTISGDNSNLDSIGFGDTASSALTAANETWELCEHSNYAGRCVQVRGAFPNLDPIGGGVSSARRWTGAVASPPPVAAPVPAASGGLLNGRTASFFAQPTFNGQPMRACPQSSGTPSGSCTKQTAEQFCRFSGFARLVHYSASPTGYLEDVLCARK
jgi:hypothetical protein